MTGSLLAEWPELDDQPQASLGSDRRKRLLIAGGVGAAAIVAVVLALLLGAMAIVGMPRGAARVRASIASRGRSAARVARSHGPGRRSSRGRGAAGVARSRAAVPPSSPAPAAAEPAAVPPAEAAPLLGAGPRGPSPRRRAPPSPQLAEGAQCDPNRPVRSVGPSARRRWRSRWARPLARRCSWSPAQAAESDAVRKAREHYRSGDEAFKAGRYEDAYREWEAGYKLSGRPLFLLNMAHAERRRGQLPNARALYQRYMVMEPETKLRGGIEGVLKEIDAALAAEEAAARPASPSPPAVLAPARWPRSR